MKSKEEKQAIKRLLVIEDVIELKLIEDLFRRNLNNGLYDLITIPDLSDERVYQRHLPEGHDVYWLHTSSTEDDAIDELKMNQPWSKLILRGSLLDSKNVLIENHLRKRCDYFIRHAEKVTEQRVIDIMNIFGIKIVLPYEDKVVDGEQTQ